MLPGKGTSLLAGLLPRVPSLSSGTCTPMSMHQGSPTPSFSPSILAALPEVGPDEIGPGGFR